jgi:hypothetical protein
VALIEMESNWQQCKRHPVQVQFRIINKEMWSKVEDNTTKYFVTIYHFKYKPAELEIAFNNSKLRSGSQSIEMHSSDRNKRDV